MKEIMIYDGTKNCGCGCDKSNCLQIFERTKNGKTEIILRDSENPEEEIKTSIESFKNFLDKIPRLKL